MSGPHLRTGQLSAKPPPSSQVFQKVATAAMRERLGHDDLKCVRVAVQGLRNVGWHLARRLSDAGAILLVSDIHNSRMSEAQRTFGATPVPAYLIYDAPVEIFVPCALGAIINNDTLARLKAKIIAGSANN